MKLKTVEINNYRLLEKCTIRLDNESTVLVGKNNSGKTSFSCIFETYLNDRDFTFDDFSINSRLTFVKSYKEYVSIANDEKKLEDFFNSIDKKIPSINMILTIEYGKSDNWSNIRPLLTSLEPDNQLQVIFEYCISDPQGFFEDIKSEAQSLIVTAENENEKLIGIISKILTKYYRKIIKPLSKDIEVEEIKISDLNRIISSKFIAAQRNVEDGNSQTSSKLSPVFQREYKNNEKKNSVRESTNTEFSKLNDELDNANVNIDNKLATFFKSFTESFSTFGYPNVEGADVILKSKITATNIFSGIRLFYKDKEYLLPEKYNGLGYSNLIYIISEILCFKSKLDDLQTDLNLIFIEEPEAHMHPQLQSTFISKLNDFLKKNGIHGQVIITTHSSHIVSNASFENIRYFKKNDHNVTVKDMLCFELDTKEKLAKRVQAEAEKAVIKVEEDEDEDDKTEFDIDTIQFLKQYITLVKCDMFFADKIILIEGLCERLLMPLFARKTDQTISVSPEWKGVRPLSEQYIAVIEIGGAYMHKFKEFLEFLDIKTLIITDLDCCCEKDKIKDNGSVECKNDGSPKKTIEKSAVSIVNIDELISSNQTLVQWIPKARKLSDLVFRKFDITSQTSINVSYQTNIFDSKTDLKCGRTFEEAFIIENKEYIFDHKKELSSIKNNIKTYSNISEIFDHSYDIYSYIDGHNKKADFAFDLMYVFSEQWNVPKYITEGLIWLAQ